MVVHESHDHEVPLVVAAGPFLILMVAGWVLVPELIPAAVSVGVRARQEGAVAARRVPVKDCWPVWGRFACRVEHRELEFAADEMARPVRSDPHNK